METILGICRNNIGRNSVTFILVLIVDEVAFAISFNLGLVIYGLIRFIVFLWMVALQLFHVFCSFKYNRVYINALLMNGYRPLTEIDKEILLFNGFKYEGVDLDGVVTYKHKEVKPDYAKLNQSMWQSVRQLVKEKLDKSSTTGTSTSKQSQLNASEIKNDEKINSVADEILMFKELFDSGVITQEEFDQKKSELLKRRN